MVIDLPSRQWIRRRSPVRSTLDRGRDSHDGSEFEASCGSRFGGVDAYSRRASRELEVCRGPHIANLASGRPLRASVCNRRPLGLFAAPCRMGFRRTNRSLWSAGGALASATIAGRRPVHCRNQVARSSYHPRRDPLSCNCVSAVLGEFFLQRPATRGHWWGCREVGTLRDAYSATRDPRTFVDSERKDYGILGSLDRWFFSMAFAGLRSAQPIWASNHHALAIDNAMHSSGGRDLLAYLRPASKTFARKGCVA
jgi:hypothetical protein